MKNMINFILHEERSVFKERFKYVFKNQNGGTNSLSLIFLSIFYINNFSNFFFDDYTNVTQIFSMVLNIVLLGVVVLLRAMYPLNMSKLMYMLPKTKSSSMEYLELKYMIHSIFPSVVLIMITSIIFVAFKGFPLYLLFIILAIVMFNATSSLNIFDGGSLLNYNNIKELASKYPKIRRYNTFMGTGEAVGIFNIAILSTAFIMEKNNFITIMCLITLSLQFICFYKLYFKMRYTLFEMASSYVLVDKKKVVIR